MPASGDVEILVKRFSAQGKYLFLWLAPEYGFQTAHKMLANRLVEQNIEVWQGNIVESLYLPQNAKSLKQLNGKYVADVIEYAYQKTGKKIVVAGDSNAAISALLGAHQWQNRKLTNPYLIGAVLFTPNTYTAIPPLGLLPEFMPIVSSTNIPIMIFQALKSGTIGQFEVLLENLRQHDSPVYTRFVPDVASLFYEEEPTSAMINSAKPIPLNIRQIIPALEKHRVPANPVSINSTEPAQSGFDIRLKRFSGIDIPVDLDLKDISGNNVTKHDYKGKVTIINFWATWCPPCVQEIPSLNRLKEKMAGRPFELISINFAEDTATILDFMERVKVEFPVLIDQHGDFAQKWNIISFPSTFVIGTDGKIKYGVNAAIEWDDPELIAQLNALLDGKYRGLQLP